MYQRMGIGTSAPATRMEVLSTTPTDRGMFITQTSDDSVAAIFKLRKSRGTVASPGAILTGDFISNFAFQGHDGTGFADASNIRTLATENWTPTSRGSAMIFQTVTPGTSVSQERLRIDGYGDVGIGTQDPTMDLEVNGGVRLNTANAQPPCNQFSRGTFWVIQDNGAGDTVQVCIVSGGYYVWRTIAN
jgi:hypothetical protein